MVGEVDTEALPLGETLPEGLCVEEAERLPPAPAAAALPEPSPEAEALAPRDPVPEGEMVALGEPEALPGPAVELTDAALLLLRQEEAELLREICRELLGWPLELRERAGEGEGEGEGEPGPEAVAAADKEMEKVGGAL